MEPLKSPRYNEKALQGLNVLVTRPSHQVSALAELIRMCGGNPILFPVIDITCLNHDAQARLEKNKMKSNDIAIFLSANAVTCVDILLESLPETIIAIGPGTHNTLINKGIERAHMPLNYCSEGILDLAVLQHVTGKNIWVFCGCDPREHLFGVLQQRGAQVNRLECYRRQPSQPTLEMIEMVKKAMPDIVISTSCEGLHNLQTLIAKHDLFFINTAPMLVVNQKMYDYWQANECPSQVLVAENATDQALIDGLISIVTGGIN